MRLLTIDQLCSLLKHALTRMKSVSNADPFLKPVDPAQFPAYKEYVTWPMDLQSIERNIRKKQACYLLWISLIFWNSYLIVLFH